MSEMIRVFVGCAANGDDVESQAVLEYSLRRHATVPVDITWMRLTKDVTSPFFSDGQRGWQTQNWSTPFSGFRWAVPYLAGHFDRAIYTDSDVIFMGDVAELHGQHMRPGSVVLAKGGADAWRFCVSCWDCDRAKAHLPSLRALQQDPMSHRKLVTKFRQSSLVQPFAGNWNCIDGEKYVSLLDPDVKAIHYSSEAHQPQLVHAVPRLQASARRHWFDGKTHRHWREDLIELFDCTLVAAEAAGFRRENYEPAVPFGDHKLMSHANYRSHRFAPA